MALVEAHRCSGMRLLISSETCLREEVCGPSERGADPELAEILSPGDAASHITSRSDAGWERLPETVPHPVGIKFDEGDRRLTVATDVAGEEEDCVALLVTDDVDFLGNLLTAEAQSIVCVFPVASGDLLLALHACGAITDDELEAVLYAEQDRLDRAVNMKERKRLAKQDALNRMAVRLGSRTA
jgi:hypothetical protein